MLVVLQSGEGCLRSAFRFSPVSPYLVLGSMHEGNVACAQDHFGVGVEVQQQGVLAVGAQQQQGGQQACVSTRLGPLLVHYTTPGTQDVLFRQAAQSQHTAGGTEVH